MHALKLSMKVLPSPLTTCVAYLIFFTLDMLNFYSMALYVSLAYTASLILQAKDCVTQVITLAYLCVCSQAPIQLPVGIADGKLSKEGLEKRLCSTCSYTPHPLINTNRKITQLQTRSDLYNPFTPPQLP